MALFCYSNDTFSVDKIRHQLRKALWLIDHYTWLIDAYMSDFFVHQLGSRVPQIWWDVLLTMEPPEMADMLKPKIPQTRIVWPLSLLAFHASVHAVSLSNEPVQADNTLSLQLMQHPKMKLVARDGSHGNGRSQNVEIAAQEKCAGELAPRETLLSCDVKDRAVSVPVSVPVSVKDGQILRLEHCYRRHVKPKKQHEIMTLAPLLNHLCQTHHCQRVIDVGAGQGHLSRLLSFGYDLNVTTVEAAGCHAPKAAKFDGEVKDDIRKEQYHRNKERQYSCDDIGDHQMSLPPRHVIATIDQHDSIDDFLHKLELNHLDLSHRDTKLHGGNHDSAKTKEHEIKRLEENPHRTKAHRNTHQDTNHEEIRGHEINHEFICCETKLNDTNSKDTSHKITNEYEQNNEVGHKETDGQLTHSKGIDHETTTKEHEINCHETKGTNCNVINKKQEISREMLTKPHETSANEKKKFQTSQEIDCKVMRGYERNYCKYDQCKTKNCLETDHDRVVEDIECPHPGQADLAPQDMTSGDISLDQCTTEENIEPTDRGRIDDTSSDLRQLGNRVDCDNTFVLTGLHTCGDLTPTLMRVFIKCREAAVLAVVTCCYMKLSSQRVLESAGPFGYPMSSFTSQLTNHRLSYEALEGACHFNSAYCRKLTENSPELVSHAYRAALQEIVMEKCPSMQHGSVRLTMRKAHHMSFKDYAEVGLQRLGLEADVNDIQLERAHLKLGRWREVVAFFTLRLSVLPVVEAVILLDRMLFLAQNDISSCLVPIFDPRMSPRNFVLLATKGHCIHQGHDL